jgi:acyl-CoA dehydrogenase
MHNPPMQDTLFTDALTQLLQDKCTPALIRSIEADTTGIQHQALWQDIESSGFADALRSEQLGGAGLSLSEAFPLVMLCGQFALPLPLAETMMARAWLDSFGAQIPSGSIAFAVGKISPNGDLSCNSVINGRVCDWVFVSIQAPTQFALLLPTKIASSTKAVFALDASLTWSAEQVAGHKHLNALDTRTLLAFIYAAQTAGALISVFERTLKFANDRQQFGRPIGKFQAIQHQLSVLAEHVFAARMAAQIGSHCSSAMPDLLRVAIAKSRTSEAALEVAALSHSIHGAIGFTAEFDLQLFTRRLHLWRQAAGSESYWHSILGEALLASDGQALDLLRSTTDIS